MTSKRLGQLKRLVRVTDLVYRRAAADLAQLNYERDLLSDAAAQAELVLADLPVQQSSLHRQTLGQVSRCRKRLAAMTERTNVQMDRTSNAMIGKQGADQMLKNEEDVRAQTEATRSMDEILESLVCRSGTSPKKAY